MQQLIEASRIQINFAIVKGVCTKGAYILDKNKLSKYENLDSIGFNPNETQYNY